VFRFEFDLPAPATTTATTKPCRRTWGGLVLVAAFTFVYTSTAVFIP
jgi:hypothetical protein